MIGPVRASSAASILGPSGAWSERLARLVPLNLDEVAVRVAPGWFTRVWDKRVAAVTLPWAIYVRREQLRSPGEQLNRLLVHELVHSRQWAELGWLRFATRYLSEYLAGRWRRLGHWRAYKSISLEREAEQIERTVYAAT